MLVKPKSAFDIYVSAAVRKERMAQRVSQATLAYGIGVSDGFISQVESPDDRDGVIAVGQCLCRGVHL